MDDPRDNSRSAVKHANPRDTAAPDNPPDTAAGKPALSLDWWTVVAGLALAALVLAGLPAIPW
ncbi:MAG: hypothetical protein ACLQDL_02240 [Spirochaetia bacterium]